MSVARRTVSDVSQTAGPSDPVVAPADEAGRGSLSPSRSGDFRTCPLLYRLRTIDRLPEAPSAAAARGTVVHRVLEELFDRPAAQRTPAVALALVEGAWAQVREAEPGLSGLFDRAGEPTSDAAPADAAPAVEAWLEECRSRVRTYFDLEDPRLLEPREREVHVESLLASGLLLRGVVDRVDVAPDGAVRVVDYKTGRAPTAGWEAAAFFQLRFYALVLWRTTGVVPALLQLMYLGDGEVLTLAPDEQDLLATERLCEALWRAVREATEARDFRPRPGRACSWCRFKEHCPEFGGTLPPWPEPAPRPGSPG